ncbi:MAG TPA: hypothetical protein VN428_15465 [Bryobacteraceae bacterium]|nr:hypothetical protein [Bryobacteraceae bacterium]
MTFIALLSVVLLVIFSIILYDRWRWKRETGKVPKFGSVGNAFLEVQALFEADKQHVLEMKQEQEEKKDQEEAGGPDEPGRG